MLQVYENARCDYLQAREAHKTLLVQCKDEEMETLPLRQEKDKIDQHIDVISKTITAKVTVHLLHYILLDYKRQPYTNVYDLVYTHSDIQVNL